MDRFRRASAGAAKRSVDDGPPSPVRHSGTPTQAEGHKGNRLRQAILSTERTPMMTPSSSHRVSDTAGRSTSEISTSSKRDSPNLSTPSPTSPSVTAFFDGNERGGRSSIFNCEDREQPVPVAVRNTEGCAKAKTSWDHAPSISRATSSKNRGSAAACGLSPYESRLPTPSAPHVSSAGAPGSIPCYSLNDSLLSSEKSSHDGGADNDAKLVDIFHSSPARGQTLLAGTPPDTETRERDVSRGMGHDSGRLDLQSALQDEVHDNLVSKGNTSIDGEYAESSEPPSRQGMYKRRGSSSRDASERPATPAPVSGNVNCGALERNARHSSNCSTPGASKSGAEHSTSSAVGLDAIMEEYDPFDDLAASEDSSFAKLEASIQKLENRQLSVRESLSRIHARLLQGDNCMKMLSDVKDGLEVRVGQLLADMHLDTEDEASGQDMDIVGADVHVSRA